MDYSKYLIVFTLLIGQLAYADIYGSSSDLRAYSLLSRLNALVDSFGNVNNYPACIYDEVSGDSLTEAKQQKALDGIDWGINQWVKGIYGENGYEGFVVQNVSVILAATTLAECDALGNNPQPIHVTDWNRCGGLMIANKMRCPIQGRTSTTLHELGHMIGLPHEFSYYDPDADHPLGPASVMNYDHFLSLSNLTENDIETAKWAWRKSQNDLEAACEDGKVHLTHACLPAYFGATKVVKSEIQVGDKCLDLNGNDVITSPCDGEKTWQFTYSNTQFGYTIERDGRCIGLDSSTNSNASGLPVQSYESSNCESSLKSVWGIRLWGENVQIQNSAHFYQHGGFDSNGCLTMDDDPMVGNCADWDNDASPMYKTMNNTELKLSAIITPENNSNNQNNNTENSTAENEKPNENGRLSILIIVMAGLMFKVKRKQML